MYGLDHGKSRFQPEISMYLRPDSGVPGLYLTGKLCLYKNLKLLEKSGIRDFDLSCIYSNTIMGLDK